MIKLIRSNASTEIQCKFWITIKSSFSLSIIDNLIANPSVIGIRFNLTKEKNVDRLKEILYYINKNYPKIKIMLDFSGKKQRVHIINEPLSICKGEKCVIRCEAIKENEIGIENYLFHFIQNNSVINDLILISDGWQQLKILEFQKDQIICQAVVDCNIYNNRGISVKNLYDSMQQDFSKDIEKFNYLVECCNIDYVAASFINSKYMVNKLKRTIPSKVKLVSKIESFSGLRNIFDIAQLSDEIMIARGDLLVEIYYYNLDLLRVEDYISSCCNLFEKQPIIATRIADSLEVDCNMTTEEILLLSADLKRTANYSPVFLLAAETSSVESNSVKNFQYISSMINLILSAIK